MSSSTSAADDTQSNIHALTPDVQEAPQPVEEPEKPKRKSRVSAATKDLEPLPVGLDILWTPETSTFDCESATPSALPPPEILEETLHNLHIILHHKTQHRSIYASPSGPPTEPTLALFCPIEGGEYIIDTTVRELARRTGSEVVVLDAVQLAAGEWGAFGKAANSLQLPRNPLHFPSTNSQPSGSRSVAMDEDDEGETLPPQMTLTVMAPFPSSGRALMASSLRRNTAPSKAKIFFDELINVPNKQLDTCEEPSPLAPARPRIIYIRDFPTLASTSSVWYPPLLSAVRQRRQGPLSRPTSPINSPMAIIFGMTPSLIPSIPTSSNSSSGTGGASMNDGQQSPLSASNKSEWGEDEVSDKAREKRLKDRLQAWERSDKALLDQLPSLSSNGELDAVSTRPEIVVIGGPPGAVSAIPPILGPGINGNLGQRYGTIPPETSFFRTSILVPTTRSRDTERSCRVKRRQEINELTIRMGIGAVGGLLEKRVDTIEATGGLPEVEPDPAGQQEIEMWNDWGARVEEWPTVRQIADRAVGSVVAANALVGPSVKSSLDPTDIPWSAVYRAWWAQKLSLDLKKAWTKQTAEQSPLQDKERGTAAGDEIDEIDELVKKIKQDPELYQHEYRLLPCIVDSASMATTFNQVHLPPHTIDSVRTVVSLPLLNPSAFQQGILKTHGMNGLLLFGPPGTGKTLVARALAKEAGCRMMAVNPSDVLDLYFGETEKLVRAVFSLARRLSPCVVFLDEIDALFGARMSNQSGSALAHRGVITEFMQEMDGLKSSKDHRVIVIGATNRPFDLDDAVLRRMPRRLLVDLPGEKEREEILKILLQDETLDPDVDLRVLAKRTASFSGSDLKHLCVSAALDAIKERMDVPWDTASVRVEPLPDVSPEPAIAVDAGAADLSHQPETSGQSSDADQSTVPSRVLALRHFSKALKEIIPSSSESLSSLADLRKWNDEFGEGRNIRKSQRVWGRGRFGFTDGNESREEGRVENQTSTSETT